MGLMEAVQFSGEKFEESFPEYRKWLQFRTSEMVSRNCLLPHRMNHEAWVLKVLFV